MRGRNRPRWPSSLERVSNSSRSSLKDPGSNPGIRVYMDKFAIAPAIIVVPLYHAKVPHHGFLAQRLNGRV